MHVSLLYRVFITLLKSFHKIWLGVVAIVLPILSFARSIMSDNRMYFSNLISEILAYLYCNDRISYEITKGKCSNLKYIFQKFKNPVLTDGVT